jgi:hypothetical protein
MHSSVMHTSDDTGAGHRALFVLEILGIGLSAIIFISLLVTLVIWIRNTESGWVFAVVFGPAGIGVILIVLGYILAANVLYIVGCVLLVVTVFLMMSAL